MSGISARLAAIDMVITPELVERFRADLEPLWPHIDNDRYRLGLAVSGGGDSLALLLIASAALPERVEAATIDHQLRTESREEAEHVARYCRELGVPHKIIRVCVAKGNLQDRARAARYRALDEWCKECGLEALATAHQMDDQVETFLMRANRGSGVSGLASIRARGTIPNAPTRLVRPLLTWRRDELRKIVQNYGWQPIDDPSNDDRDFDRVRIRQALVKADWIIPEGIERSARLLAEADEVIGWIIKHEHAERVVAGEGEVTYDALHTNIGGTLVQSGVIRLIFKSFDTQIDRRIAARLVEVLRSGEKANVAGIEASIRGGDGEEVWLFRPENPRNTS